MVKKLQKNKPAKAAGIHLSGSVKDSAQQIWQAGLGAFTRAQAEGSKAFEALVKEGVSIQRKTQAAAEGKITEATTKMSTMATDISTKASGQWDKLENIFEERVAKALNKLGVPSAKDVAALISRIDELNKAVQKLSTKSPAAAASKPAAKAATKKPVAKKAATKTAARPAAKPAAKAPAKAARTAAPKPAAKAVKKVAAKRAKAPAAPVVTAPVAPAETA
jgi:poly(hydroxyalkanoate) granule-associated protein